LKRTLKKEFVKSVKISKRTERMGKDRPLAHYTRGLSRAGETKVKEVSRFGRAQRRKKKRRAKRGVDVGAGVQIKEEPDEKSKRGGEPLMPSRRKAPPQTTSVGEPLT